MLKTPFVPLLPTSSSESHNDVSHCVCSAIGALGREAGKPSMSKCHFGLLQLDMKWVGDRIVDSPFCNTYME
jgi:hypothetical protein